MEITVITPFHNVDMNIFESCFHSMVSQTIGIDNIEWIIVLHNCDQEYVDAVKEKTHAYKNILTPELYNDARTPSSPRNYGLSLATGKYIGFLDGDDSYISTCLETALKNIKETNADILCFKREYELENSDAVAVGEGFLLDQTKERILVNKHNWEAEKTFVSVWGMVTSKIYKAAFLKEHDLRFDEEIPFGEDAAFNIKAYPLAENICYLPQYVGYHYYINSASLVQRTEKDADTLTVYAKGIIKILESGMKNGIFMNNMIGGLLYHISRFLELSDLSVQSRRQIRDILLPYMKIVKPFEVCEIYTEEDVKLRYDYPKKIIPEVGAVDIWEDRSKKEYPLTFAQKYQKAVMEAGHSGIEAIELDRYYELDADVDEEKLKAAVSDTLCAHDIYRVRVKGSVMKISDDMPVVSLYYFTPALFKEFRTRNFNRKINCETEAPVQADIICCVNDYCNHDAADDDQVTGKKYLHLKISHYVYDAASLKILFDEINDRYDGHPEKISGETITMFDISDREDKETDEYKQAEMFFDRQYADRDLHSLTDISSENTIVLRQVLSDMTADELNAKVRNKELTTGVFIIGIFEKTLADYFGQKDFAYMLLSDGRNGEDEYKVHGVMAKGVYVTSSVVDFGSDEFDLSNDGIRKEYFARVSFKVRQSIANNIVDFSDLIQEYKGINSLVTINYAGSNKYMPMFLGKAPEHRFSSEHAGSLKAFAVLNFHIEKVGSQFNLVAMSYSLTRGELDRFIELFEQNVKAAL